MGRANRLLAGRVTAIATGFPQLVAARREARRQNHLGRQSGPAGGDPGVVEALRAARAGRAAAPAGVRRQPGRAGDGRHRAARDRATRAGVVVAPAHRAAGARGGFRRSARTAYADCGVAAEVAPFFADLPARMAASPSRDLALRRFHGRRACRDRPALRSWCRCRMRSIRTRWPMPAMLQTAGGAHPAGAGGIHARAGWPRRYRALAAEPARAGSHGRAAAKKAGTLDAAERLADLVLRVAKG